jgi:hypothetical protein
MRLAGENRPWLGTTVGIAIVGAGRGSWTVKRQRLADLCAGFAGILGYEAADQPGCPITGEPGWIRRIRASVAGEALARVTEWLRVAGLTSRVHTSGAATPLNLDIRAAQSALGMNGLKAGVDGLVLAERLAQIGRITVSTTRALAPLINATHRAGLSYLFFVHRRSVVEYEPTFFGPMAGEIRKAISTTGFRSSQTPCFQAPCVTDLTVRAVAVLRARFFARWGVRIRAGLMGCEALGQRGATRISVRTGTGCTFDVHMWHTGQPWPGQQEKRKAVKTGSMCPGCHRQEPMDK